MGTSCRSRLAPGNVINVLDPYVQVLRTPGSLRFTSSGFIARMPMAITGLSIVLVVSNTTGSYGLAGGIAAGYALATAGCGILTSRLVDQHGQRRVLRLLAIAHALCLLGFVAAVWIRSVPAMFTLALLAGACQPSIGPAVRARWSYALRSAPPASLRTAFAIEGIWDELIFTVGPLIATALALHVWLQSPLLLSAGLVLVGTVVLSAQARTEPPITARHPDAPRQASAIRSAGMPVATLLGLGLGSIFGSFEVSTVALTERVGEPGSAGLVLAVWAACSGIGGLWFGSRHIRATLPSQAAVTTGLLSLGLVPAAVLGSVPSLFASAILSGLAVAPSLMLAFALAERLVKPEALTEGLTWIASGLNVGFSAGVALAGVVVDAHGPAWAFTLPLASSILVSATLLATRKPLQQALAARPSPEPSPSPARALIAEEIPGPGPGWQPPD